MKKVIILKNVEKKYFLKQSEKYFLFRERIIALFKKIFSFSADKKSRFSEFWALKDINFSAEKGQVIGVIGPNGAGKSTLLKIISKITHPSNGELHIIGSVASLLEVGTGFHPELSGRENIFLNGAILGMSKQQISDELENIINFSGIKKFIDIPVKRYSSGMSVRLAFAVAAHLNTDILLIDEVLAVGDMDFQKKCLNKIDEITKEQGRTIIFVSHNISSILQLTNRAILIEEGRITKDGQSREVVDYYLSKYGNKKELRNIRTKNSDFTIKSFTFQNKKSDKLFNSPLHFNANLSINETINNVHLLIGIQNSLCARILTAKTKFDRINAGIKTYDFYIRDHRLAPGDYKVTLSWSINNEVIMSSESELDISLNVDCSNEELLLPHASRGRDRIGAFYIIDVCEN